MPNAVAELTRLLPQLFKPNALNVFLVGRFGVDFTNEIVSPDHASSTEYAFEVAQHLDHCGYVDRALFQALADERKGKVKEISEVSVKLGFGEIQVLDDADVGPNIAVVRKGPLPVTFSLRSTLVTVSAVVGGVNLENEADLPEIEDALWQDHDRLRASPQEMKVCKAVGDQLARILFQVPVLEIYLQAITQARAEKRPLQLRFKLKGNWGRLAWEMIRLSSGRFLAMEKDLLLTRVLAYNVPPYAAPRPNRNRLLLAYACPPSQQAIQVEPEAEAIQQIWQQAGGEVVLVPGATKTAIRDAVGNEAFTAFHFAGHGLEGALLMQDETMLSGEDLAAILTGRVAVAAYLNACYGAAPEGRTPEHPGFAWDGTAGQLAAAGIIHTLASGSILADDDALRASKAWHQKFLETGDPVRATGEARFTLTSSEYQGFGFLAHLATGTA